MNIRVAAFRNHRDRVVRTLRRTVAAADTCLWLDIDLAVRKTCDRSGRAAGQALGVLAVHADGRDEDALDGFGKRFYRTLDMDAATHQTRLAMNLVTGERAIAAANALRHVHHEQIYTIDHARLDLFGRGSD